MILGMFRIELSVDSVKADWCTVRRYRKQHYDKSPNCPFFTETVQGQPVDGNLQDETGVDDNVSGMT